MSQPEVMWDWTSEVPDDLRQQAEAFVAWLAEQHPTCSVTEVVFLEWGVPRDIAQANRWGIFDRESGIVNVYCDSLDTILVLDVVGHEFAHDILGKGATEDECCDWSLREVSLFLSGVRDPEKLAYMRTPEGEAKVAAIEQAFREGEEESADE